MADLAHPRLLVGVRMSYASSENYRISDLAFRHFLPFFSARIFQLIRLTDRLSCLSWFYRPVVIIMLFLV